MQGTLESFVQKRVIQLQQPKETPAPKKRVIKLEDKGTTVLNIKKMKSTLRGDKKQINKELSGFTIPDKQPDEGAQEQRIYNLKTKDAEMKKNLKKPWKPSNGENILF